MKKIKIAKLFLCMGHSQIINAISSPRIIDLTLFINKEKENNFKNDKIKKVVLGKLRLFTNKLFIGRDLIRFSMRIEGAMKKDKFDIFHVASQESLAVASITKTHLPIVVSFHGTDVYNYINEKRIFYRLLIKPFISRVLDKAILITSVGREQIKSIPDKYKSKIIVIPNGVNSKVFKPIRKIKQKKNVILFVGNFIDIKGIQEIVNVAKQLTQYEFWFAGQGPLVNLINLPNTKNLGFKSTEELVKLYNQANICIFPSYRESFGLVGLEAMACGRAVIATPLGFSEYIENGKDGIIIPARDKIALKNAIVYLMTNKEKRKMLEKNARKKALKYSWDKVAKRYLDVYKKVLKESKKKSS